MTKKDKYISMEEAISEIMQHNGCDRKTAKRLITKAISSGDVTATGINTKTMKREKIPKNHSEEIFLNGIDREETEARIASACDDMFEILHRISGAEKIVVLSILVAHLIGSSEQQGKLEDFCNLVMYRNGQYCKHAANKS